MRQHFEMDQNKLRDWHVTVKWQDVGTARRAKGKIVYNTNTDSINVLADNRIHAKIVALNELGINPSHVLNIHAS